MSGSNVQVFRRADFALLCNARGLRRAVEIGTYKGAFARQFMERFHGEELWCVDHWARCGEMSWDREGDLMMAAAVLAPFADRCSLIRATSAQAAVMLALSRVDFVYIDAAHDRESVASDIGAWWPLLPPGGVLAGHDYMIAVPAMAGVVQAVDALVEENVLSLNLTVDANEWISWWVEKPC